MSRNPKREQRRKSVKYYFNKMAYNKPTLKKTKMFSLKGKQMKNVFWKWSSNKRQVPNAIGKQEKYTRGETNDLTRTK